VNKQAISNMQKQAKRKKSRQYKQTNRGSKQGHKQKHNLPTVTLLQTVTYEVNLPGFFL
jgi:hypothetical protein